MRNRLFLILLISIVACVVLYVLGALLIQSIMLVGYVAMLPTILVWEKYSNNDFGISYGDQRLGEKKKEIGKLQKQIDKSKSQSEKKDMMIQKKRLENEFRRLEWSIRESNLTKLRETSDDEDRIKLNDPEFFRSSESGSELDSDSKITNVSSERNFDLTNREKREQLVRILEDAKQALAKESQQSIRTELLYLANDVRAHYNVIRKKDPSSSSLLSDYWVVWVVLYSQSNNSPQPSNLEKYASPGFRSKFISFAKFINSQRVSAH
jgi:hypothetical protein